MERKEVKMTLEQLQKKRDGCEQAIRKANAEKDEIDKQIDDLVFSSTKKTLTKYRLSIVELLKLNNATENELKGFLNQLRKESKENKDVSKKEENHEKSM